MIKKEKQMERRSFLCGACAALAGLFGVRRVEGKPFRRRLRLKADDGAPIRSDTVVGWQFVEGGPTREITWGDLMSGRFSDGGAGCPA
jgi:hypothetical protein